MRIELAEDKLFIKQIESKLKPRHKSQLDDWGFSKNSEEEYLLLNKQDIGLILPKVLKYFNKSKIEYSLSPCCKQLIDSIVKKEDKFDYNFHEALTTLENDNLPENSIIDVIQDGWKFGNEVLRYAKVVISKKPKPPEPPPKAEEPEVATQQLVVGPVVAEEVRRQGHVEVPIGDEGWTRQSQVIL